LNAGIVESQLEKYLEDLRKDEKVRRSRILEKFL
jgi:hypothetical protein